MISDIVFGVAYSVALLVTGAFYLWARWAEDNFKEELRTRKKMLDDIKAHDVMAHVEKKQEDVDNCF